MPDNKSLQDLLIEFINSLTEDDIEILAEKPDPFNAIQDLYMEKNPDMVDRIFDMQPNLIDDDKTQNNIENTLKELNQKIKNSNTPEVDDVLDDEDAPSNAISTGNEATPQAQMGLEEKTEIETLKNLINKEFEGKSLLPAEKARYNEFKEKYQADIENKTQKLLKEHDIQYAIDNSKTTIKEVLEAKVVDFIKKEFPHGPDTTPPKTKTQHPEGQAGLPKALLQDIQDTQDIQDIQDTQKIQNILDSFQNWVTEKNVSLSEMKGRTLYIINLLKKQNPNEMTNFIKDVIKDKEVNEIYNKLSRTDKENFFSTLKKEFEKIEFHGLGDPVKISEYDLKDIEELYKQYNNKEDKYKEYFLMEKFHMGPEEALVSLEIQYMYLMVKEMIESQELIHILEELKNDPFYLINRFTQIPNPAYFYILNPKTVNSFFDMHSSEFIELINSRIEQIKHDMEDKEMQSKVLEAHEVEAPEEVKVVPEEVKEVKVFKVLEVPKFEVEVLEAPKVFKVEVPEANMRTLQAQKTANVELEEYTEKKLEEKVEDVKKPDPVPKTKDLKPHINWKDKEMPSNDDPDSTLSTINYPEEPTPQIKFAEGLYYLSCEDLLTEMENNQGQYEKTYETYLNKVYESDRLDPRYPPGPFELRKALALHLAENRDNFPEFDNNPPAMGAREGLKKLGTQLKSSDSQKLLHDYQVNFTVLYQDIASQSHDENVRQQLKNQYESLKNKINADFDIAHVAEDGDLRRDLLILNLHYEKLLQEYEKLIVQNQLSNIDMKRYYTTAEPIHFATQGDFDKWKDAIGKPNPQIDPNKGEIHAGADGIDPVRVTHLKSGWLAYPPSQEMGAFSEKLVSGSPYEMVVYSLLSKPKHNLGSVFEEFKNLPSGNSNQDSISKMLDRIPEADKVLSTIIDRHTALGETKPIPIDWIRDPHMAMAIHALIKIHGLENQVSIDSCVYDYHTGVKNDDGASKPPVDIKGSVSDFVEWQKKLPKNNAESSYDSNLLLMTRQRENLLAKNTNTGQALDKNDQVKKTDDERYQSPRRP